MTVYGYGFGGLLSSSLHIPSSMALANPSKPTGLTMYLFAPHPIIGEHVPLLFGRSQHHDRDPFGAGIALDPLQHLQTLQLGQFEINHHHSRHVFDLAAGMGP